LLDYACPVSPSPRSATDIGDARRELLSGVRLYFVCEAAREGWRADAVLEQLLLGGVDMLELRDKGANDRTLISAAASFRAVASDHGRLFLINDRPDLVEPTGADGVHLGQDDMPVARAREALGAASLIGLSTHTRDQIDAAQTASVDYISVGPIWKTPTKEGRRATGLELIEYAARNSALPFFAIGGIDEDNLPRVLDAGASRICVVRAIRDSQDPGSAAHRLRETVESGAGD
jgi:thiamine-phosphate pyrophosphorylase